ncbi:MAG: hypothetical protein AAFU65_10520 [Pseudomonadota bacterium]
MKSGVFLAALVVIGFAAFELYAATRNGYRMAPDFVYGEFIEARRGSLRCGTPTDEQRTRFAHNYAWARYRAGLHHAESNQRLSDADVAAWLAEREATLSTEVDAQVDELGCKDPAVRKFSLRFRNLARLSLPAVPADSS